MPPEKDEVTESKVQREDKKPLNERYDQGQREQKDTDRNKPDGDRNTNNRGRR